MRSAPDPERLRFADWMARALHDPQHGYYARQVRTVGRRGDFATSASVGTVLGEAIAQWLREELAGQRPRIRAVIEAGGGDGALSAEVRRSLGWWQRLRLDWHMVETSAPLREQQQARLGTKRVRWFADMGEALRACEGRALIFHNELLDAFPVDLYQWDAAGDGWREVWVVKDGEGWQEELAPAEVQHEGCAALAPAAWGRASLREGQRVEMATACREWLRMWAPHWKQGAMLTIDYGDEFPRLYNRQPRGTVRGYFMQQRITGVQVYDNVGRQDVTADVNFTDVMAWGELLGWRTEAFTTQRDFLRERVPALEARGRRDPAIAFLTDEHGAGAAFKVLVQRRV